MGGWYAYTRHSFLHFVGFVYRASSTSPIRPQHSSLPAWQPGVLPPLPVKDQTTAKPIVDAVFAGLGISRTGSHSRCRTGSTGQSLRLDQWCWMGQQNRLGRRIGDGMYLVWHHLRCLSELCNKNRFTKQSPCWHLAILAINRLADWLANFFSLQ